MDILLHKIIVTAVLGFVISYSSLKLKFLSVSGAIVTFFLTFIVFYLGDVKWTVPILTFFILSSLLSKIRKRINPKVDSHFPKTEMRDRCQVLANGGFPGLVILCNQFLMSELFYIIYVSAIAAVCADTWATEIGNIINVNTYDVVRFHIIEQGISGGVSIIGFCGSLLGAIVISVSALPWLNNTIFTIAIFLSGILASIFDSILGSTVQCRFKCTVCNEVIEKKEHCGFPANHLKGFKWLNNDGVNFATSVFGGLISIAFSSLIS